MTDGYSTRAKLLRITQTELGPQPTREHVLLDNGAVAETAQSLRHTVNYGSLRYSVIFEFLLCSVSFPMLLYGVNLENYMRLTARTAEQIGEALRRSRKARGLTQKDISEKTNLRVATISSLENGDPGTQLRTVMSVLAALDLEFVVQERSATGDVDIEDIFS